MKKDFFMHLLRRFHADQTHFQDTRKRHLVDYENECDVEKFQIEKRISEQLKSGETANKKSVQR